MNLKTDCARILSAAAVALAAAGAACGAEAKALPSGARMEPHDFNGVRRAASLVELTFAAGDAAVIDIELDGVNMLDDYPTIDWMMDVSQPGAVQVVYLGAVNRWDQMDEYASETGGVTAIRREIGHCPRWASWMDVRKMDRIRITVPRDSWKPTNETQRVWISDIRLEPADSWAGTDRDARYRAWLDFCDTYVPDLSDSSKYLEPPAEGRLATPLKLVEDHVAKAEIVAPRDTYNSLELAARELRHWIWKMTGAELPIVAAPTGTKPVRIFLNDPAAQARWADDVAWLKGGRDVDGWFVHTDGSDIHICSCVPNGAGMDDMAALGLPRDACPVGVFRGAIAFLENNSTILFAGLDPEIGTVYDESPDFTVRWGEGRARPSTCCRGWFGGNDTGDKAPIDLSGPLMWIARTGGNARLPHRLSGHAFGVGEMIEYVPDEDPYRVWDGTRRIPLGYYNGQICLGATDVVVRCIASGIASAKGYLADDYPLVTIGFFNEDNWQVCVCENCTRPIVGDDGVTLRSGCHSGPHSMADDEQVYRSTQYMQFVNRLADGVAAKYPGVKTEILAYLFQRPTPKCRISDNVAWMYCPYKFRWCYEAPVYHPSSHHVYDNIVAMQAKGGEMHVYDYHAFAYIDTRALIAEASAEDYRWYTERGGRLLGAEFDPDMCSAARPGAMLNAWLFNRVGWDADLRKVEQLRKFYLRRLYREGAPAAEAYFARRRCGATHRPMPGVPDDAPEYEGLAARKLFRPYRNKIANPMARRYFEILEKAAVGKDQDGRVDVSDADWFRTAAAAALAHAERTMSDGTVVYAPQGQSKYDAFWLRDYEMMLEAGIVPSERIVPCAKVFLNAVSPQGEGVDCVRFDGTPVYSPGYGTMGEKAVLDGCAYTVLVACHSWRQTGDAWFLDGERLALYARVLAAIPHDANGLSWIDPAKDWERCPWGFTDTVKKTGACLFSSLLEVAARRGFAELLKAAGKADRAAAEAAAAEAIAAAVNAEFWDESAGLYRAASVRCREHDVFGTAYAVWLGVAAGARADRIAAVFRDRYGDFVANGQVRHLPKGVYWEACAESAARDAYQNGGYWGMATGWFAWALARVDPALAGETLDDLRQACERNGSPEWTFGDRVECPEYLATLALPYQCLRRLEAAGFRRNGQGKEEGR